MTNTKKIAVAYYTALGKKDLEEVKKYIHPDIQFSDPMETKIGKEAFLEAASRFSNMFDTLKIFEQFGSEEKAMIVYEVNVPSLAKPLRAASLLGFREGMIVSIELIYDRLRG